MKPPFIFRLFLGTLFLPIVLAFGVLWHRLLYDSPDEVWETQSLTLGLPDQWIMCGLLGSPFVLWLWIFCAGRWRKPLILGGLMIAACFLFSVLEIVVPYTPPEKRLIHIGGMKGAEVYCNGVLLGRIGNGRQLKIRVEELVQKVPQWTTPPEQYWYDNSDPSKMLYTWFPWDDFIKERFEASKALFGTGGQKVVTGIGPKAVKKRQEELNKHDAACRYWWSVVQNTDGHNTRMAFLRVENQFYLNTVFDRTTSYNIGIAATLFSPSAPFHGMLLTDVLPELTPEQKADWDRHVLKHWPLVGRRLQPALNLYRQKSGPFAELYKKSLDSTARLKYGLSDPPTEDECRKLLDYFVAESIEHNLMQFYPLNNNSTGAMASTYDFDDLIPSAEMLGDAMRKPLAEQWRKNRFRYENGFAPVAGYSGQDKSPAYFGDFARYVATTQNGRNEMLSNDDPSVAALFATLLHRSYDAGMFSRQKYIYPTKIRDFDGVMNPRTEPIFRNYIIAALSDPKHDDQSRREVERAVVEDMLRLRIFNDEVDKTELGHWVATLPLPPRQKSLSLGMIRARNENTATFADKLQKNAGFVTLIETDLTLEEVTAWFAAHPKSDLKDFCDEHEDRLTASYDNSSGQSMVQGIGAQGEAWGADAGLWVGIIRTLLQSEQAENVSETEKANIRAVVKQLWNSDAGAHVIRAIQQEFGPSNLDSLLYLSSDYRLGTAQLPDYLLDLIEEAASLGTEYGGSLDLGSTLALCDSPRAGKILEMWLGTVSAAQKPRWERYVEIWQTRNTLRQKRLELFADLVSGQLSPDDLLLKQPAWHWKEGKYVQAE